MMVMDWLVVMLHPVIVREIVDMLLMLKSVWPQMWVVLFPVWVMGFNVSVVSAKVPVVSTKILMVSSSMPLVSIISLNIVMEVTKPVLVRGVTAWGSVSHSVEVRQLEGVVLGLWGYVMDWE